jgi:hypothetical protein
MRFTARFVSVELSKRLRLDILLSVDQHHHASIPRQEFLPIAISGFALRIEKI